MSNYRDSDYALNYKRSGIVYRFADSIVEITMEEFLNSHPNLTEQDFLHWKRVSDEMHLEEKRATWRHSNKDCLLNTSFAHDALTYPSAEEVLLADEARRERERDTKQMLHLANTDQ